MSLLKSHWNPPKKWFSEHQSWGYEYHGATLWLQDRGERREMVAHGFPNCWIKFDYINLSPCSYCLINPLRESQLRFGMNQWSRVHWYCAPPCDKSYSIHMLWCISKNDEWTHQVHCSTACRIVVLIAQFTVHRSSRKTPSTSCLWMQFFTNSRFPTFQGQPITSPSGPSDITWTKAPPGSRYRKMACNRLVSSSPGTAKWRQHVASWRPWLWGVRTNTWPFNTSRK